MSDRSDSAGKTERDGAALAWRAGNDQRLPRAIQLLQSLADIGEADTAGATGVHIARNGEAGAIVADGADERFGFARNRDLDPAILRHVFEPVVQRV